MTRGIHQVRVRVAGAWVDLSCEATEVTIHHGRSDPESQPEASTATVDLYDQVPAGVDVGTQLQVSVGDPTIGFRQRFAGRVTDLSLDFDNAVDPDTFAVDVRPFARITAADQLADMGRTFVGDAPYPQELEGARIVRALTPSALQPGVFDPGTVQLLSRDVDRQPALDLVQSWAAQAGGLFFVDIKGIRVYQDAEHRRANVPAFQLDACEIVMSPEWKRDMSGLVNEVAISYGPTPDGGDQPVYTTVNADSQTKYGRVSYSATTELATLTDATTRGSALLARNAYPVWDIEAIQVITEKLDDARYRLLCDADIGTLVGLTGLPIQAPSSVTALWIEGWEERLALYVHEITLQVSGYCRTAPFPRWDDVNPATTWDTIAPPSLTWDDMRCLGPVVSAGRWADVPGNLQWNNPRDVNWPTVTWNTWPY